VTRRTPAQASGRRRSRAPAASSTAPTASPAIPAAPVALGSPPVPGIEMAPCTPPAGAGLAAAQRHPAGPRGDRRPQRLGRQPPRRGAQRPGRGDGGAGGRRGREVHASRPAARIQVRDARDRRVSARVGGNRGVVVAAASGRRRRRRAALRRAAAVRPGADSRVCPVQHRPAHQRERRHAGAVARRPGGWVAGCGRADRGATAAIRSSPRRSASIPSTPWAASSATCWCARRVRADAAASAPSRSTPDASCISAG
jgi:hypothetical protein